MKQLRFDLQQQVERPGDAEHPILNFPLLQEMINQLQPDLLETRKPPSVLDAIGRFLFTWDSSEGEILSEHVNAVLMTALEGLKYLLRFGNINTVHWMLEEQKEDCLQFLQEILKEDE